MEKPHQDKKTPGHDGREQQSLIPLPRRDPEDDPDERRGWATDLDSAAPEHGNKEPGDDRGKEPHRRGGEPRMNFTELIGNILRNRSDPQRHRQRQRNDGDGQPREQVARQEFFRVALVEADE